MADGAPVRSLHSLPSKNLNIPPPIEYAKPPIKETSIKEANSAKGGLLCLWSSPLSVFTDKFTFSLNSMMREFEFFLHEAKNPPLHHSHVNP